jgi:hypothetical protein
MSQQGVDATVERLCTEPALVRAVVRDGEPALAEGFDLTPEEKARIVAAVRADVEAAVGDVEGFLLPAVMPGAGQGGQGMLVPAVHVAGLVSFDAGFDRKSSSLAHI